MCPDLPHVLLLCQLDTSYVLWWIREVFLLGFILQSVIKQTWKSIVLLHKLDYNKITWDLYTNHNDFHCAIN